MTVLGDFGDKDLPEPGAGGAVGATVTGTGGVGGQGGDTGGGGTGGAGGMGGSGGVGGTGGAPVASCPSGGKGPAMVKVPGPDSVDYCVDVTEVSVEQYAAWLATKPDPAGQGPACDGWNTSFEPLTTMETYCTFFNYADHVASKPKRPMQCVDWCDAQAFCKWAGKRLCGAAGGGTAPTNKAADPEVSEWFRACSEAGARDYPYGDTYDSKSCVGRDFDGDPAFNGATDVARNVGSTAGCEGGYPGIFDMSGNVWEWEDSCSGSTGSDDDCLFRGGGYADLGSELACENTNMLKRDFGAIALGFRCCADVK